MNNGPDINELYKKAKDMAGSIEFTQQNALRIAPWVTVGAVGMYFFRRPLAVTAGVAGLAMLAGPEVLEAGRQWALEEIKKRRGNP